MSESDSATRNSAAERQRRRRARLKAAGWVEFRAWVPSGTVYRALAYCYAGLMKRAHTKGLLRAVLGDTTIAIPGWRPLARKHDRPQPPRAH